MIISFSTISRSDAERYLSRDEYSYLNEAQKEIVLANLGDTCRVQDPHMYSRPAIELTDPDLAEKIRGAGVNPK